MNEHVVVLIVGKTASGKSSLVQKVCERNNWTYLKSYTTRPQRNANDIDHVFVDEEFYWQEKEAGNIAAEANIAGNYYFSTIDQVYKADFYTINPDAVERLKALNLPGIKFVTVYIKASDQERERRAISRGDDKGKFKKRCFSEAQQFRGFVRNEEWDYAIDNFDFAKAYSMLKHIANIENVWKNHEEGNEDLL